MFIQCVILFHSLDMRGKKKETRKRREGERGRKRDKQREGNRGRERVIQWKRE